MIKWRMHRVRFVDESFFDADMFENVPYFLRIEEVTNH